MNSLNQHRFSPSLLPRTFRKSAVLRRWASSPLPPPPTHIHTQLGTWAIKIMQLMRVKSTKINANQAHYSLFYRDSCRIQYCFNGKTKYKIGQNCPQPTGPALNLPGNTILCKRGLWWRILQDKLSDIHTATYHTEHNSAEIIKHNVGPRLVSPHMFLVTQNPTRRDPQKVDILKLFARGFPCKTHSAYLS